MQIQGLGIVDDTIYITDTRELVSWPLEASWRTAQSAHDAKRVTVGLAIHPPGCDTRHLALSHDCSQIAFAIWSTISLYNVGAREILDKHTMGNNVVTNILFSPSGRHLYVITSTVSFTRNQRPSAFYFVKLKIGEDRRCVNATKQFPQGDFSRDVIVRSHYGYGVRSRSEWVEDSGGNKVLWLPPSWGTEDGLCTRWDDNFLALVGGKNLVPIIIEF